MARWRCLSEGDLFIAAAERHWFVIAPDGMEHSLVLSVGIPVERDNDWSVAVSLGVLDSHVRTIYGVDSWQAMHWGMKLIGMEATDFAKHGWRFYWTRGGDEARHSDLFL